MFIRFCSFSLILHLNVVNKRCDSSVCYWIERTMVCTNVSLSQRSNYVAVTNDVNGVGSRGPLTTKFAD
jgi:hypothetical protein